MFGLLATGFQPKPFETIRDEIIAALQAIYGTSIDVGDDTKLGQFIGVFAERAALLWELQELVYNSRDPDAATGAALEQVAALTGTTRDAATSSTVTLTLTGTPATIVALGSQASVTGTGELFQTTAAGTITATTAWVGSTAYAIGDRVTNSSNVYVCTVAGTSAGAGGPSGTSDAEVDGSVTWRFIGAGTADVDVAAESVNTGPIVATSGDIVTIATPVAGWDAVKNLLDATLGQNLETDEDLRLSRTAELGAAGSTTFDAARSALLNVAQVQTVSIFTNVNDPTNVPACFVEALVFGGDDQAIGDTLFAEIAAGISYQGSTSVSVTDNEGGSQTVKFSRPTEIEIYINVTVTKDPVAYPLDGDAQVSAALVAYGDAQVPGRDVVVTQLSAAIIAAVPGVLDVPVIQVGTSPSPTGTSNIVIALREIAVYDTSRINVTSNDGTP